MSSSVHANNKINNILFLSKRFIQGINVTTIYLHYNGDNSYLFVNGKEICNSKQKILKLRLTGLYGQVHEFSIEYDSIPNDKIIDLHMYLMKKHGMI